jgi:4-amino-4-deoxy-L-arabinose transferase-like glycosyltransferase
MKNNNLYPFYLTIIAIFLIIVAPNLLSDGMFMDGLLYATISRNLANGLGSFWQPHLTDILAPQFHGHPPLAFGIQSLFFRIFGDTIYVERIYSVSTFFITGYLMVLIWKIVTEKAYKHLGWLPLCFWITIPLVTWSASNNMLENTMMVFTTLSLFFILKSIETNKFVFLFYAGISLFLAFLTKGFVGLYPLSLPFWTLLFKKDYQLKRFLIDTFVIIAGIIIPFVLMINVMPESKSSLISYINEQVIDGIKNKETVGSRFYIISRLLKELLPASISIFIIYLFTKKIKFGLTNKPAVYIMTALSLAGVIPIMISLKQRGFYIDTVFPVISLVLAMLTAPRILFLINKINISSLKFRLFKKISAGLLIISIIFTLMNVNRVGRDKEKLKDVYSIIKIVPENSIILVQPDIWTDWTLHGYLARYANISMENINSDKTVQSNFILVYKNYKNKKLDGYKQLKTNLLNYNIYKNNTPISIQHDPI